MANTKPGTTTTDEQTAALVLEDAMGNYFLLRPETLEQGRVPEEHKAQIEHLIAEQQEVQGYATVNQVPRDCVHPNVAIGLAKVNYVMGLAGLPAIV